MTRDEYPDTVREALASHNSLEAALLDLEGRGVDGAIISDVFKAETRERLIEKYRTDRDRLQEALSSHYPPVQNGPVQNYR